MKDRIRQLMEAQHMNQQAFARFTNIGSASLSSIFTGRTRPTMNHVTAIMEAFPDVNPKWLIQGVGPMMTNGGGESELSIQPSELIQTDTDDTFLVSSKSAATAASGKPTGVQGSLFTENSFIETAPETQVTKPGYNMRNTNPQRGNEGRNSATDNLAVLRTSRSGHITEIRVFFDDQTWESFVPKK